MGIADKAELGLVLLSLAIWIGLLGFRGQFWHTNWQLEGEENQLESWPSVCAVIPARNEADLLPITLRSLLGQDYPGSLTAFLVDDSSTDGTAEIAEATAQSLGKEQQLKIVSGAPLPAGWTGKLWALEQGIEQAQTLEPDYFLLTDADIKHDRANLSRLVAKAEGENLDLASVMVRLRCETFWEQLLIPAFVFFFAKLYPFRWVNDRTNKTAAAAGGCLLIRRSALNRIGGLQTVRQALIDDCALAQAVKNKSKLSSPSSPSSPSPIWLGLSSLTCSLRPYPSLASIWNMVARSAFTQLNYSPWLLGGTLVGMTLTYLVSPVGAIAGSLTGNWLVASIGWLGWLLMTLAYLPIIRFYKCSPWLACCLSAIAFLYTLMTLDSAWRYWRGRGGAWKGRVYKST
jgi:hopene-associated glycosyltransferase HpnB